MTVYGETGNAVTVEMTWMAGGKSSKVGIASRSYRPRREAPVSEEGETTVKGSRPREPVKDGQHVHGHCGTDPHEKDLEGILSPRVFIDE